MKFLVTSVLVFFHTLFLKCCCGGWIDPDTPSEAKQITSLGISTHLLPIFSKDIFQFFFLINYLTSFFRLETSLYPFLFPSSFMHFIWSVNGKTYDLVMSDEFNIPGRSFADGNDPRWTAMNKNDYTNAALQYYRGV